MTENIGLNSCVKLVTTEMEMIKKLLLARTKIGATTLAAIAKIVTSSSFTLAKMDAVSPYRKAIAQLRVNTDRLPFQMLISHYDSKISLLSFNLIFDFLVNMYMINLYF